MKIMPLEWHAYSSTVQTSANGLVEIRKCEDGTWRASCYPFADKQRNISNEELAKEMAESMWSEFIQKQID